MSKGKTTLVKFHERSRSFLFGTRYHLLLTDAYGEKSSGDTDIDVEWTVYEFLRDRGFKVKWYGRFFILTIRSKEDAAQFSLINVGVVEVEVRPPQRLPVFKI
jgi:hypothetical protein